MALSALVVPGVPEASNLIYHMPFHGSMLTIKVSDGLKFLGGSNTNTQLVSAMRPVSCLDGVTDSSFAVHPHVNSGPDWPV